MAQKTRAQLDALIAANLPNNVSKLITPIKHREVEEDLTESNVNILDDVIETSAGAGSAGKLVKLAANGKFDPSTLPAIGSAAWGGITGDIEDQTDLQDELALLAPLDSPQITGSPFFDLAAGGMGINADGNQIINFDEIGVQFRRPIIENPRTIGDGDSTTVDPTDLLINYERTDSAPLVLPETSGLSSGQNLKISNRSSDAFDLTTITPNSFFNGADGIVSVVTVQPNQTVSLQALVSEWQVISSYLATAPIETVTVSSGAADVGKAVLLDAAGLFDPSVLPSLGGGDIVSTLTSAEIPVTGATTLTLNRMHLFTGTSADYTGTLPSASGNAGKFIGGRMGTSSTLTVFVTVNGQVYWSDETFLLISDGTNWKTYLHRRIPMACSMALSSIQSITTAGSGVKILLDTTLEDNTGKMADPTTNNRITIVRAGKYIVVPHVRYNNITAVASRLIAATEKNGVATFVTQAESNGVVGGYPSIDTSVEETYAAGDTVELWSYQTSLSSQNADGTGTTEGTFLSIIEQIR